jgi:ribosomal protein S18 acetylase RimI-like enzyme
MVTVKQVNGDKKGMRDFLELPYDLYKNEKNWCPPLRFERKIFFSPKNPYRKHSEVGFFVAYKDDRPVGRVTAHRDDIYDDLYKTRQGFFGFYESIENDEVAEKLMQACETWIQSKGMDSLMGPFNFSTNHEVGFLTKGFERPPVIMMPYTKRYYPDQLLKLGYKKEKELLAFWVDRNTKSPELFSVMAKRVARELEGSYSIRTLNMADLKAELKIILDIYNEAWNKNWGFVPMTEEEIDDMASQIKHFAIPEFIYILSKDDEPAAFLLGLPDINNALIRIKSGKLFPTGIFKLLAHKKYIQTGRILLLGVKSQFRNQGLDLLLYHRLIGDAMSKGPKQIKNMELSWILEDNHVMVNTLKSMNADPYKSYLIVKKSLENTD